MGDWLTEWGLSILVETDGVNVLLDTGKSMSTSNNANALDIDLGGINQIVLSHGHFDHTGGLHQVLIKMRKEVEIIAHPDIWVLSIIGARGKGIDILGYLSCARSWKAVVPSSI